MVALAKALQSNLNLKTLHCGGGGMVLVRYSHSDTHAWFHLCLGASFDSDAFTQTDVIQVTLSQSPKAEKKSRLCSKIRPFNPGNSR